MSEESRDVALALSSGGPRGLAYIGAIRELESRGYRISAVAGTSMGALIGGIYSAGGLDDAEDWFMSLDAWRVFRMLDFSFGRNHIVKGDKVVSALENVVPDVRIEDLGIPFCAVATDLYTGDEVVFREGSLFRAIRASISIPGLMRPVRSGNSVLVDGGIVNPIPLDRVSRRPGDILVGFNANDIDRDGIRKTIERNDEIRRMKSKRGALVADAMHTVRRTDGSLRDRIKAAEHEGGELIREIRREGRLEEIEIGGSMYTLLDRTFDLMNHRNTMLRIAATPPDILVSMPFDAYGAVSDYARAREISDLGRSLMADALDRYEGLSV